MHELSNDFNKPLGTHTTLPKTLTTLPKLLSFIPPKMMYIKDFATIRFCSTQSQHCSSPQDCLNFPEKLSLKKKKKALV